MAEIAGKVGLSTTPCWRRIQKMEAAGVIRRRVALLDGDKLNVGVTVFVSIKTNRHDAAWLQDFAALVAAAGWGGMLSGTGPEADAGNGATLGLRSSIPLAGVPPWPRSAAPPSSPAA